MLKVFHICGLHTRQAIPVVLAISDLSHILPDVLGIQFLRVKRDSLDETSVCRRQSKHLHENSLQQREPRPVMVRFAMGLFNRIRAFSGLVKIKRRNKRAVLVQTRCYHMVLFVPRPSLHAGALISEQMVSKVAKKDYSSKRIVINQPTNEHIAEPPIFILTFTVKEAHHPFLHPSSLSLRFEGLLYSSFKVDSTEYQYI